MAKTNFDSKLHGFHFANYFINQSATLPGIGQISTAGRCGGMAYSALDHYFAQLPIPVFTGADFAKTGQVPPDGHPLSDYIYKRQLDSFMVLSAAKFVTWTLTRNARTWFNKGITEMTKQDEFAKFRASIDRGVPVTLGLIYADELSELGRNHQVVGYGYEIDKTSGEMIVYIYDVNYADQAYALLSKPGEDQWRETSPNKEIWRGWFVQDYSPKRPPDNLNAVTASMTRGLPMGAAATTARRGTARTQTRGTKLAITLERVTFSSEDNHILSDDVALSFNVGGQSFRWPANGLKTVDDGKSYKLNKQFEVMVAAGGALTISAQPATSDAIQHGLDSGLLNNPALSLGDTTPAGIINDVYDTHVRWGKGTHSTRSSGSDGVYTLVYSIKSA